MRKLTSRLGPLLMITLAVLTSAPAAAEADASTTGTVRHVVIFKYKDGATAAQIQQITDGFRALQDRIPGILAFENGVNNSPENLNRGLTHAYVLTFADAAARDAYLPHPEHAKFGELVGGSGILDEVFVFDYSPAP